MYKGRFKSNDNDAMKQFSVQDQDYMRQAIDQARQAQESGEVPIGAVLVDDSGVIAKAYNQPIERCDPTAHAEILVLRQAGQQQYNYRLLNTTLYVTLEPCIMCAAAMVHARIKRLVFAAADMKTGACGSVCDIIGHKSNNHRIDCSSGLFAEDCSQLLRCFFQQRRKDFMTDNMLTEKNDNNIR